MATHVRLAITTGDPDGIGTEVASKALFRLGPKRGVQFILWRDSSCPSRFLNRLDKRFTRITFAHFEDFWLSREKWNSSHLIDICSPHSAAHWVVESAKLCLKKQIQGLVTGPISKSLILENGFSEVGHTGLLKSVTGRKNLSMAFLGQHFNVMLLTDHIPLQEVSSRICSQGVKEALKMAKKDFICRLPKSRQRLPIGLLGLNPHSGEGGILGREEVDILKPLIKWASQKGLNVQGPLVPDAAFLPSQWGRYSLYLSLYHDQGLIPFKLAHESTGSVHLTLGLPFIRVSVDHGTAKDIFLKDKAKDASMYESISMALKMSKG